MQKKIKKFLNGFTVIELTISITVIAVLSVLILSNYRKGEKSRGVLLGTDVVASALRTAQSLSLNPQQIQTTCGLGTQAKEYRLLFQTPKTTFTLSAIDKCGNSILLETYNLPSNIQFPVVGFTSNSAGEVSQTLELKFTPPFAKTEYKSSTSINFIPLRKTIIPVGTKDGTLIKFVTYSANSGRVDIVTVPNIYAE